MKHRFSGFLAIFIAATLVATACADDGEQGGTEEVVEGPSGTLVFASFNPFTGPNGYFGPFMMGSCWTAVDVINQEGGILGNDATCERFDTHGDPTQAVPAGQQMIASTGNLVGILGPSSDEAQATAPVLDQGAFPFFADTGLVDFNETDLEYFWRTFPADDSKGIAMAIVAAEQGFTRGAIAVTSDPGAQSLVPTVQETFEALGGEIVIDLRLAHGQSSYRTEAQRILSAEPDVIFTESDARSAATFLGQMQELNNELPAVVGSELSVEPPYVKAVSQAVGFDTFSEKVMGVVLHSATSGPAYEVFKESALSSEAAAEAVAEADLDAEFLSADPFAINWYDSVNIMALAMIAAGTTDPATYNSRIIEITNPGDGKVVVGSFAEGKEALEAGEDIQYEGVGGPYVFNEFHNAIPAYEALRFVSPTETESVQVVPVEQLTELGS